MCFEGNIYEKREPIKKIDRTDKEKMLKELGVRHKMLMLAIDGIVDPNSLR